MARGIIVIEGDFTSANLSKWVEGIEADPVGPVVTTTKYQDVAEDGESLEVVFGSATNDCQTVDEIFPSHVWMHNNEGSMPCMPGLLPSIVPTAVFCLGETGHHMSTQEVLARVSGAVTLDTGGMEPAMYLGEEEADNAGGNLYLGKCDDEGSSPEVVLTAVLDNYSDDEVVVTGVLNDDDYIWPGTPRRPGALTDWLGVWRWQVVVPLYVVFSVAVLALAERLGASGWELFALAGVNVIIAVAAAIKYKIPARFVDWIEDGNPDGDPVRIPSEVAGCVYDHQVYTAYRRHSSVQSEARALCL